MKKPEFKVLARFASSDAAYVVKTMLDSMGIESEILNEVGMLPFLETDVRILVNTADYDRAKEILDAEYDKKEIVVGRKKQ